jgi:ABC-type lipoprotein export system ATPase subunit/CRP-like cAMP-binding protein
VQATRPSQPLIAVRDLVKVYRTPAGEFTALQGLDLDVRRGEFVAVIGKSGSGKSTFINLLAGIDRPTSGQILIGGAPIHTYDEARMAAWRGLNLGIVFQFFQLIPTLTVIENVLLPMELNRRYDADWRYKRARHLLKKVEMEGHADKLPAALSGGQQQRTAIARALANDPPLLVADEPTGNLDTDTAERVFRLFKSLAADGTTVLMVTHDGDLARRVDRTLLISDGRVVDEVLVRALAVLTPDQLAEVARRVQPQVFARGASIVRQGEQGEHFYIVLDGTAEVLAGAVLVDQIGPGGYFGELALLGNGLRTASVRASGAGEVKVAALDAAAFNDLVQSAPALRDELRAVVEAREQAVKIQALAASEAETIVADLTMVAAGVKRRTFAAGEQIFRQGEIGASTFILEDGAVDIFRRDGDAPETRLETLARGALFGQTALDVPRRLVSARVTDAGPAACIEYEPPQRQA